MARRPAIITSVDPRFLLYRNAPGGDASEFQEELARQPAAHHGLRFAKFFGRFQAGGIGELIKEVETDETDRHGNSVEKTQPTEPLLDWLDPRGPGNEYRVPGSGFGTLGVGDAERLNEACRRIEAMAERSNGRHFRLSLVSRLLTGIGLPHPIQNGFLFHPTLGVPYVPGTALKQVAQDWAEEEEGMTADTRAHYFGSAEKGVGRIAFLDALPAVPLTLTAEQITNHYPGYYQNVDPAEPENPRDDLHQPADWYEPNPVSLLAVEASRSAPVPFAFGLVPLKGAEDGDLEKVAGWLKQGLEIYGVGARTTLGFGRFETEEVRACILQRVQKAKKEMAQQIQAAAAAAPPAAGERMRHDELGIVEVIHLRGDMARVYSLDEATEEDVPLAELRRP